MIVMPQLLVVIGKKLQSDVMWIIC